ncbi:DnaJ domain-containing protein [Mycena albidolilacea]|uniref:DnaJ domain-containing protein n=1 Tax=Mycena albidolilacea TaxID=1033008 RepID=A0AAD7AJ20_9AGAR|nr:DnaJ domain-containing protein [Mycena albidolilacea]
MARFPDYYKVLNIEKSATQDEIRAAYKKEALRTHPDRTANASAAEKQKATEKFQAVGEAYYVLSDSTRRREYDAGDRADYSRSSRTSAAEAETPHADDIFADVFAELLRPEIERHASWWSYLGTVCGAGIGFMIGSFPGVMIGAAAGNRLGAVRDAKGKNVAAVFNDLGENQKAEILRALAFLVLASTTA